MNENHSDTDFRDADSRDEEYNIKNVDKVISRFKEDLYQNFELKGINVIEPCKYTYYSYKSFPSNIQRAHDGIAIMRNQDCSPILINRLAKNIVKNIPNNCTIQLHKVTNLNPSCDIKVDHLSFCLMMVQETDYDIVLGDVIPEEYRTKSLTFTILYSIVDK